MTNPSDLLTAIVEQLQAIPQLVTLLCGDAARISAYQHQWPTSTSWMLAVHDQKPVPSLLALYRGTRNSRWGSIPVRAHEFSLILRAGENVGVFDLWTALMEGVPTTGGGLRWYYAVHAAVDMIQEPELVLRTLQVTPELVIDYHEVTFALTEKYGA